MNKCTYLRRGAGLTHHSIMTYQERLATYIDTIAREGADNSMSRSQEQLSANMTSLFRTSQPSESGPSPRQAALDSLGKSAGIAAQALPS